MKLFNFSSSHKCSFKKITNLKKTFFSSRINVQKTSKSALIENENVLNKHTPWYLKDKKKYEIKNEIDFFKFDKKSPESLLDFLNLLTCDYKLENIIYYDNTKKINLYDDEYNCYDANYVILCTGLSEKHIFKVGCDLKKYIKNKYKLNAYLEGHISESHILKKKMRLRKKSKKSFFATENDYGNKSNSWVICDSNVDKIIINLFTEKRRKEIDLESLWDFTNKENNVSETNNLLLKPGHVCFVNQKKFFCTSKVFNVKKKTYSNCNDLSSLFNEFLDHTSDITKDELEIFKKKIDSKFNSDILIDHRIKYDFYNALHFLDHNLVSFSNLEDVIFKKYANMSIFLDNKIDLEEEKQRDLINYAKLLIDSKELKQKLNSQEICSHIDNLYNLFSNFIAKVYFFSELSPNIFFNPILLFLLWRISFIEKNDMNESITSLSKKKLNYQNNLIYQGNKKVRDLLYLYEVFKKKLNHFFFFQFKELTLYTYGNSGKWNKFWNEWDLFYHFLKNILNKKPYNLLLWRSLVEYLALRSDKSASLHFLNNYWNNSINCSFMYDYKMNNSTFNFENEKIRFQNAMNCILNLLNNNNTIKAFNNIKFFIDHM